MSFSAACFEFASGPPVNDTKRSQTHLREWNADINSSDDIFNLNELEEFKSTDLTSLILGRTAKRSQSESPLQEPPSKRRKLDIASLRNAIPQVVYFVVLIIHSFSRKINCSPMSYRLWLLLPRRNLPSLPIRRANQSRFHQMYSLSLIHYRILGEAGSSQCVGVFLGGMPPLRSYC
jgi:hypothetical protein